MVWIPIEWLDFACQNSLNNGNTVFTPDATVANPFFGVALQQAASSVDSMDS